MATAGFGDQTTPRTPDWPLPGYQLRVGNGLDRALLVKFMQRTYQDLYPDGDFAHLALTVEQYFSRETPLWWIDWLGSDPTCRKNPVACLWLGNAIDQLQGDRHAHIFLVYVAPDHRRKGLATALIHHAAAWAQQRGDRQLGLQVFQSNQPALNLYQKLGFQAQSLWMAKPLQNYLDS